MDDSTLRRRGVGCTAVRTFACGNVGERKDGWRSGNGKKATAVVMRYGYWRGEFFGGKNALRGSVVVGQRRYFGIEAGWEP